MNKYSVWVGGGEINNYPLTYTQAHKIARLYRNDGYKDVIIEKLNKEFLCD
jgi:hypothetical protein